MGLNAAVYKKITELPFTNSEQGRVSVDPMTGQVDFEDAALFNEWGSKVKATEKRLGNIALVEQLKKELQGIGTGSSSKSLLFSRVLYRGTHSGDIISYEQLSVLKHEIDSVRGAAGPRLSPELETFLTDMEELANASERHGNPIVFV